MQDGIWSDGSPVVVDEMAPIPIDERLADARAEIETLREAIGKRNRQIAELVRIAGAADRFLASGATKDYQTLQAELMAYAIAHGGIHI